MKKLMLLFTLITCSLLQAFDSTIPVLHLPDYTDGEKRELFLEKLESAMRDVGFFFAITGMDVEIEVLDTAYAEAKSFFSLASEKKLQYQGEDGDRGFVQSESA